MAWGDKGTLFVSSRVAGNVYAVVDQGGQREVKVIAKGLNLPNGVAFKDGTLYVAEVSRITRMPGIEDKLDNPPAPEVVYDILPRDLPHGWKYLAFGPDGKLYFNIGAPCNICVPPDTHANISRVNPDGTGFEYVAHGVRNSVGFDWHPVTKELYFATHARDWLGDDVPSDRLDVASKKGLHFGFPYCHQGDILDPEFGKGRSCAEFAAPLLKTGPHVAGNGVQFYTGSMFPAEYQNRIFLAQRGSWNRTQKIGFRVMMVTLRPGDVPKYEVFAEGWLQGDQIWGRPVYTQQMKDGSLLIADDYAGAIYRVSLPALTPAAARDWRVAAAALCWRRPRRPRPISRRAPQGRRPCAACHGPDGNATMPGTPSLAGQPVFFTHWQLIKYRDGRRKDPQMSPLAEKLRRRGHGGPGRVLRRAAAAGARPPPPTRRGSPPGSRSRSSITAPRVTGPGSPASSRPRAWPGRTSPTCCGSCAPSRRGPPRTSTGR